MPEFSSRKTSYPGAAETEPSLVNQQVDVVVPDGKTLAIKYQWMRLHPLSIIADFASDNLDDASLDPSVIEVAQRYGDYQLATENRDRSEGSDVTNTYSTPYVTASHIPLDLRDLLLPPPLLSDTVDAIFAEDENDHETLMDVLDTVEKLQCGSKEATSSIMQDLESITVIAKSISTKQCCIEPCFRQIKCHTEWNNLSEEHLLDKVSPGIIGDKVKKMIQTTEIDNVGKTLLVITILILLSKYACSLSMGRHILQRLAPSLFVDICEEFRHISRSIVDALDKLVSTLLIDCHLNQIGRSDLFEVAKCETLESDLLNELIIRFGIALNNDWSR